MNCDRIRQSIAACDDPAEVRFDEATEAHLAGCAACSAFRREMSRTWRLLGELPEIEPAESFKRAVLAKVEEAGSPARNSPFRPLYWIAAAACFALLTVPVLLRWSFHGPTGLPEPVAATDVQDDAFLEELEKSLDRTDTGYLPEYGGWNGVQAEPDPGVPDRKAPPAGPAEKEVDRNEGA